MPTRRSRVPRSLGIGLATAFLASGVVSACSSGADPVTEDVYCANENGEVIDEKYCDDDRGNGFGGFIWIGSFGSNRGLGYRLSGGQHFPYNDAAARERAGLPRTGNVTGSGGLGGKVTRPGSSKGGGFGGLLPRRERQLMERRPTGTVRENWPQTVTDQGLTYWQTLLPSGDTRSYWREGPHYAFSAAEVDQMHADMVTLFDMFVSAGDFLIAHPEVMDQMGIPEWTRTMIARTWDRRDAEGHEVDWGSVYGRIDAVYGGNRFLDLATTDSQDAFDETLGRIRLYEFNADTPTSLLETAIVQWSWFETTRQGEDQWNGVYEMLVEAWQRNLAYATTELGHKPTVYFACTWHDNLLPELADAVPEDQRAEIRIDDCSYEDLQNLRVMQETCRQAGYETEWLYVEQIHLGADGRFYDGRFPDGEQRHLDVVFKLHAWEFICSEPFGRAVFEDMARPGGTIWVEPPYKMLWSNKGLLPVLWRLFGRDPERSRLLIPAWFEGEQPAALTSYVRKPLLGREGANVTVVVDGETVLQTPGDYGAEGFIVQAYAPPPNFVGYEGDNYPTLGLWYVDGVPAGLDIRESESVVVDNLSVCVPHVIRG